MLQNFKCFDCDFRCSTEKELIGHCEASATRHRRRWLCVPCLAAFPSELTFNQHNQCVDVPAHRYCNSCNIIFSTLSLYRAHCVRAHGFVVPLVPPGLATVEPNTTSPSEVEVKELGKQEEGMEQDEDDGNAQEGVSESKDDEEEVPQFEDELATEEAEDLIYREVEAAEPYLKSETHQVEGHAAATQATRVADEGCPKIRCFECQAQFSSQNGLRAHFLDTKHRMAWPWVPSTRDTQPSSEGGSTENNPDARHCATCNIFFGTVRRLQLHKIVTHKVAELEERVKGLHERVGMATGDCDVSAPPSTQEPVDPDLEKCLDETEPKKKRKRKAKKRMKLRQGEEEDHPHDEEAKVVEASEIVEPALCQERSGKLARTEARRKRRQRATSTKTSQPSLPQVEGVTLNARDLKFNFSATTLPHPLPAKYFEMQNELRRIRRVQLKERAQSLREKRRGSTKRARQAASELKQVAKQKGLKKQARRPKESIEVGKA